MPQEGTPARPPVDEPVSGGVGAAVSNVSGGQIAVGNKVIQISAEHGSVVVAGDTQPLRVVRRPPPIERGLRAPRTIIGRQAELNRIHALLDHGRSVELVGSHGIGKTTVLGALSTMPLPQAAADGVVAPPAGLPVEDACQFVFDACLERSQRIQPTPEEVLRHLRGLRLLLLVDDTELARGDVERLVAALPNSVFVISCTEALMVDGHVPITLHGLRTEDAVQLLATALGRKLGPDEADAAVRLTEGLAGVPLEILQLAAVAADRGLSLNTLAYDIAPTIEDPRAALQSATEDTLDARERSVLVALAAFGGVAVGIGLLAKYAAEPEAGIIVRRLVDRGLARGDDLVGWAPVDASAADEEDRRRAAPAIVAWAREEGRDPREVADQSPAILTVARQDLEADRYDSVIRLAAATEAMLALAGNWGAWKSILKYGVMAARAVADHASEAFFSHQLAVRADMLRPRTLAEEHLTEAMQEPHNLYRTSIDLGGRATAGGQGDGLAPSDGTAAGGLPKWALPLGIGLIALVAVLVMVMRGGDGEVGIAIAADDLVADQRGDLSVAVTGPVERGEQLEITISGARSLHSDIDTCEPDGRTMKCDLVADGGPQQVTLSLVPLSARRVTVTATLLRAGRSEEQEFFPGEVTESPPPTESTGTNTPQAPTVDIEWPGELRQGQEEQITIEVSGEVAAEALSINVGGADSDLKPTEQCSGSGSTQSCPLQPQDRGAKQAITAILVAQSPGEITFSATLQREGADPPGDEKTFTVLPVPTDTGAGSGTGADGQSDTETVSPLPTDTADPNQGTRIN